MRIPVKSAGVPEQIGHPGIRGALGNEDAIKSPKEVIYGEQEVTHVQNQRGPALKVCLWFKRQRDSPKLLNIPKHGS